MNISSRFTQQKHKSEILDSKHKVKSHGKEMWTVLHTTSAFLPEKLNKDQEESFSSFVKGVLLFGTKFNKEWNETSLEYIKNHPFNFCDRENSMLWVCNFHNYINMKTEKDLFECTKENLSKRWGSKI
jgi:FAD-linked sulfhydryl oxidase